MLLKLFYAAALVFTTVFVHGGCTTAVLAWLRSGRSDRWAGRGLVARAAALGVLVLVMSLAAVVEASVWAGFYVKVHALPAMDDALYFSLVTFTTLGYGDVTVGGQWRVLAAFEAANGIILFGWTTALIVAVGQRLFLRPGPSADGA